MRSGAGPRLPLHLRLIRAALRRLNISLSRRRERRQWKPSGNQAAHSDSSFASLEAALRKLQLDDPAAEAYFEKHLPRLKRTLSLIPRPSGCGRVLELGSYMQLTPLLKFHCGFSEVYAAEYGAGATQHKAVRYGDAVFESDVDLFDAERDRYPYPAGHFAVVLACEVLEHMLFDPMHLLLEVRRVLEEGGRILLTTPNIASLTSVARVLHGPTITRRYTPSTRYREPLRGRKCST
jgi:SAM-dependent methyltransferase